MDKKIEKYLAKKAKKDFKSWMEVIPKTKNNSSKESIVLVLLIVFFSFLAGFLANQLIYSINCKKMDKANAIYSNQEAQ